MLNNFRGQILELFGVPKSLANYWVDGNYLEPLESSKQHENNRLISSHQRSIVSGSIFLPPTWYVPTIIAPLKMFWMIFLWTVLLGYIYIYTYTDSLREYIYIFHLGPIWSSPSVLLLHFVFWPGKLWYIIWNMKQTKTTEYNDHDLFLLFLVFDMMIICPEKMDTLTSLIIWWMTRAWGEVKGAPQDFCNILQVVYQINELVKHHNFQGIPVHPYIYCMYTPPKFNKAPEKWWLEDYFPFWMAYFQGLC